MSLRNSGLRLFVSGVVFALPSCGASEDRATSDVAEKGSALGSFNVLTRAYDNRRTGVNPSETVLTPSNVNADRFGKLFELKVDDELYASLLYASSVTIGGAPRNVIYAATVANTVYAFDADSGAQLWQRNYNGGARVTRIQDTADFATCYNVTENTGITGTPVIDDVTQTIYFVTHTEANGVQTHALHAVDIATGNERSGSPVNINPTGFDSRYANQRPALTLSNGVVYVAFASHCDQGPYHGWMMGFDASTLARTAALNVTPSGSLGGIWLGGAGPAVDEQGNVYVTTGNGTFDGQVNFGMSLLKLAPRGLLRLSYFTPGNYAELNDDDMDFGSAGPTLMTEEGLVVNGGKGGAVYVVEQNDLGGRVNGDTQIPQRFAAVDTAPNPDGTHHIHNAVVVWKGPAGTNMYVWGENDYLRAYRYNPAQRRFETPAFAVGSVLPPQGMPGGMMTLSANGSQPGTGIVWATTQAVGDANNATVPGTLRAFDASDLRLLWESRSPGDDMLALAKYNPPLVANGRVYVASFSGTISVYGPRTGPTPPVSNATYQLRLGTGQGLCVDVQGASREDGAPVQQYTCNGTPAQRWNLINIQNDVFELRSEASGKCLDVRGASAANGAAVQQYTCNGTAAQRWSVQALGAGVYRLVSRTGSSKCLDVPQASSQNAVKLQQYTCNGTAAQSLTLVIDGRAENPIPEGSFRIRTGTAANRCLDAVRSLGNRGDTRQLDCNGSAGQRYRFVNVGSGLYEIHAAITERCLDVSGASPNNGAEVQQYLCNHGLAQRWLARSTGNGMFQLMPQTGANRCLDINGGSAEVGASVQQWACNGTPAQAFSIVAP